MKSTLTVFSLVAFHFLTSLIVLPANVVTASLLLPQNEKMQQDDDEEANSDDGDRMRAIVVEIKKQGLLGRLAMEIDQLKESLELDDKQVRKLSIVAKAVSGKRNKKWVKQMDEYGMWEDIAQGGLIDLDELEKADLSDFSNVPSQILLYIDETESFGLVNPALTTEKLWIKTLNSVLDEDQLKRYEESVAKRSAAAQKILTDYLSQFLARELVLNEEKTQAMIKFVESEFKESPIRADLLSMQTEVLGLGMSRLSVADTKELEKILSKNQLNRYRAMMSVYSPDGFMFVEEADFEFEFGFEEEEEDEDDDEAEMDDE